MSLQVEKLEKKHGKNNRRGTKLNSLRKQLTAAFNKNKKQIQHTWLQKRKSILARDRKDVRRRGII